MGRVLFLKGGELFKGLAAVYRCIAYLIEGVNATSLPEAFHPHEGYQFWFLVFLQILLRKQN